MCVISTITRAGTAILARTMLIIFRRSCILALLPALLAMNIDVHAAQRLIVRFTDNTPITSQRLAAIADIAQSPVMFVREASGGNQIIELDRELGPYELKQISDQIQRLENVISSAPDRRYRIQLIPNDQHFDRQWYLQNADGSINAVDAWDFATGSNNTVIAVLDTGILPHNDLSGRYLQGYDFISDLFTANDGDGRDNNPADPGDAIFINDCDIGDPSEDQVSSWHGTAVTGVIAANTNNENGIAGIDHKARLLPVRVLGRCGGYVSDMVDALRWAAGISDPALPETNPNPADFINLSFGGTGECTAAEQDAINEVTAAGVLVVAGAGNLGIDVSGFAPANCDNVLTVAASTRQGGETCYTNFGEGIAISAPGGNVGGIGNCSGAASDAIYTTSNSGLTTVQNDSYEYYVGTSFSTPMVTATAALVHSINPSLSPADIQTVLLTTAREFPQGTSDSFGDCNMTRCGSGLLDANRAVQLTREEALMLSGDGTIQMTLAEECVEEYFPSVIVGVQRLSGSGAVAARIINERISAEPDNDFGRIDTILTWADGDTETQYVSIPISDDNAVETAEYFTVGILQTSPNATIGATASTTITIVSTDSNAPQNCAPTTTSTPGTKTPPVTNTGGSGTLSLVFLCISLLLIPLKNLQRMQRQRN